MGLEASKPDILDHREPALEGAMSRIDYIGIAALALSIGTVYVALWLL